MSSHHLIISGTGRSGTSVLVKFFSACGLDSQLKDNQQVFWDEAAKAGVENNILLDQHLPYVLKAPWHSMFISQAIATRGLTIDAVLIPVRDLVQAAASRLVLELRSRYKYWPELLDMPRVDSFGYAAGGCIYSMNPIDQAREAALGFHRLVLELVQNQIPIVFLEFPRFATDFSYLYDQVSSFLPPELSRQRAKELFRTTMEPDALRMEKETNLGGGNEEQPQPHVGETYPSLDDLDNIALRRRVKELVGVEDRLASVNVLLGEAEARRNEAEARRNEAEARLNETEKLISALYASKSWRMTKWLRALRSKM